MTNTLYARCKPGLRIDVSECIFASWDRVGWEGGKIVDAK